MRKRWQQVQSIILSYLATIIGLPVIYSLDQQLPIFSGFTDTQYTVIVFDGEFRHVVTKKQLKELDYSFPNKRKK